MSLEFFRTVSSSGNALREKCLEDKAGAPLSQEIVVPIEILVDFGPLTMSLVTFSLRVPVVCALARVAEVLEDCATFGHSEDNFSCFHVNFLDSWHLGCRIHSLGVVF